MTRILCLEMLRFSFFVLAFSHNDLSRMPDLHGEGTHLLWIIADDPSNGGLGWTDEMALIAEAFKKGVDLVLAQVGMLCSQMTNVLFDRFWPYPQTDAHRPPRFFIERFRLPAALLERCFPEIQGASGDSKCVLRDFRAMFLEESKDLCLLLCFFCDHTAPSYGIICNASKASDSVSNSDNLHTPWFPEECNMYVSLCSKTTSKNIILQVK